MKLTVGVPTVSRLSLLREALDSLSTQTFTDFEVLISENSGLPAYAAAVDALIRDYPRLQIRVLHWPHLSMAANANALLDHARGAYWLYLPDDDRLCKEGLAVLATALDENPGAGFSFGDHWLIDVDGRIQVAASELNSRKYGRAELKAGFYPAHELFRMALAQNFALQGMMFRSPVVQALRFREESGPHPDFDLELRLWQMPGALGCVYCAAKVVEYRIHGEMSTAETARKFRSESLKSMIASLEEFVPAEWRTSVMYKKRLARLYAMLALESIRIDDRGQAFTFSGRALQLNPLEWRALSARALSLAPTAATVYLMQVFRRTRQWLVSTRRPNY